MAKNRGQSQTKETNKPIQDKGDDAEVAKLCGWMLIIDNPYDRHTRWRLFGLTALSRGEVFLFLFFFSALICPGTLSTRDKILEREGTKKKEENEKLKREVEKEEPGIIKKPKNQK
jgi:hypothetical protein